MNETKGSSDPLHTNIIRIRERSIRHSASQPSTSVRYISVRGLSGARIVGVVRQGLEPVQHLS